MKLTVEIEVKNKLEAYQAINKLNMRGFKVIAGKVGKEKKVSFDKDFKPKDFLNKKPISKE